MQRPPPPLYQPKQPAGSTMDASEAMAEKLRERLANENYIPSKSTVDMAICLMALDRHVALEQQQKERKDKKPMRKTSLPVGTGDKK